LLSVTYGEYVSLQRHGIAQFDLIFSHEPGYVFGECVWDYLQRPHNLIYCELSPNNEVYLVVVKDYSVYIDGIYSLEDVPQELLVFTTAQDVKFDIYTYGNVPISVSDEPGKVCFKKELVQSFTVLKESLITILPGLAAYRFQPVEELLRQQGAYVAPAKYVVIFIVLLIAGIGYYIKANPSTSPETAAVVDVINTYVPMAVPNFFNDYNQALMSPDPTFIAKIVLFKASEVMGLMGWNLTSFTYQDNTIVFQLESSGTNSAYLLGWARAHNYTVALNGNTSTLTTNIVVTDKRAIPTEIFPLKQLLSLMNDYTGNFLQSSSVAVGAVVDHVYYKESNFTIGFNDLSPEILLLLIRQFSKVPVVLLSMSINFDDGFSGNVVFQVLGN
jgi:hypothetical protein